MSQVIRCPKCAADVPEPKHPCPRCGYVAEHPQRRRYRKQVVAAGVTVVLGYALGMLGTAIRVDALGVTGLALGFVGGIWLMLSLYFLLRTGV